MTFQNYLIRIAAVSGVLIFGQVAANDNVDAARIYQESCSVCHGDDGSGAIWGQTSLATPPRDFRSTTSHRELSRERMIASVTYGRPQTPMPGFATQLSMAEIAAVVDYIRAAFMSENSESPDDRPTIVAAERNDTGESGGLVGDVARGRDLYQANCVPCHGVHGDGNGPRAYFIFPKPRNFLDPATRAYLTREKLLLGVEEGVIGKEMPAWNKVLSDQEIADVSEYVYQQFLIATEASQ